MPDAVSRFSAGSSYAEGYDAARPAPPAELAEFLIGWSGRTRPVVVDLGAGTGLSTMIWAAAASQVTAVEPSADMRAVLVRKTAGDRRFTVSDGTAEATGLPAASADIVTASTAMHWFDVGRAIPEIARVLRPGGLLAAYAPYGPLIDPETDAAFAAFDDQVSRMEKERGLRPPHAGDEHAVAMRRSGQFRYVTEMALHGFDQGDTERLMALARSRGGAAALLAAGVPASEIGLARLQAVARRRLPAAQRWWWTFRIAVALR